MKIIYKYPLTNATIQVIGLPEDAEILTVQTQNNIPTIWAIVNANTKSKIERVQFAVYGTGELFEENVNHKYIGTYQLANGNVFHLFKVIIAGSREFNNYNLLKRKCDKILSNCEDIEIVNGYKSNIKLEFIK